jgi:hypothetical protein
MVRKKGPKPTFQEHIAAHLDREHEHAVVEQAEIIDRPLHHRIIFNRSGDYRLLESERL